jgi:hypothetical protein
VRECARGATDLAIVAPRGRFVSFKRLLDGAAVPSDLAACRRLLGTEEVPNVIPQWGAEGEQQNHQNERGEDGQEVRHRRPGSIPVITPRKEVLNCPCDRIGGIPEIA